MRINDMQEFLPMTADDIARRGWDGLDFILITGDAYVDHPSFGAAIISRLLESRGYTVGILSQPDFTSAKSFRVLGKPRLAFLITSGNIDSMVNHYTVSKKKRAVDVYSPGGKPGLRPDRAAIAYSIRVREAYGPVPIILGGLEASLRRLAHYDYWTDKIRRSLLLDAHGDLLVYGMGERAILEIAAKLKQGKAIGRIRSVRGTVFMTDSLAEISDYRLLPAFKAIQNSKKDFAAAFFRQYENSDHIKGKTLVESYEQCFVVQNPPSAPLTRQELDDVYELNYARNFHPVYAAAGGVPALQEVKFSLTSCRGCFGNCHFCSLAFHQGRIVSARSHESLVREAEKLRDLPDFKGYIHDVGGPTANFRRPACNKQLKHGSCRDRDCLTPRPCPNLVIDHQDYATLLAQLQKIPGIKKVFVRSGLRFDYLMADPDRQFFAALVKNHVSGQLKVAPEHVSDQVLAVMNKAPHAVYEKFKKRFQELNEKFAKKQFLVPYYISGHPGSTLSHAVELASYFRENHYIPEQVQDFYPTPGTVSTCMYHTGLNPRNGQAVYAAKSGHEKAMQRALLQFNKARNYKLVYEGLIRAGRRDLIGFDKKCLIRPRAKKKK